MITIKICLLVIAKFLMVPVILLRGWPIIFGPFWGNI